MGSHVGLGANPPVGECGGKDQVSHTTGINKIPKGESTMFEDKVLICRDCGREFTFTAGEQEFYAEKGFQNEPVRCRECRTNRKNASRNENREMYDAVCAECGGPGGSVRAAAAEPPGAEADGAGPKRRTDQARSGGGKKTGKTWFAYLCFPGARLRASLGKRRYAPWNETRS